MTNKTGFSAAEGAAIYSKNTLLIYDFFVLGLSNALAWKCPSRVLLDFYNKHVSGNHLDVGVGTGYFLDKCRFPSPDPRIVLVDLNRNSLQMATQRIGRYHPKSYLVNILEPLQIEVSQFDSIGLGYLLHCLPGPMAEKRVVFANLRSVLNEDGVVFGSTILGMGIKHNFMARMLLKTYNAQGIFSNTDDNYSGLESILQESFQEYSIRVEGTVALFWGKY
jgi:ubiquinone/menaquinone biosynthesis C-methylase UbiE